ncbi:MAG: methyltransferase domain-containing protein [Desulfovermiculus sp.]
MNQEVDPNFEEVIQGGPFSIRFPKKRDLDQDEEWCQVEIDGQWQKIRFHDYRQVYNIPGLYETIFYRTLRCNSPNKVVGLLEETLNEHSFSAEDLCVLDVGAGNGMVGEVLQTLGTRKIVGIDIIPEAKEATERDRSWVYNEYYVADLTALTPEVAKALQEWNFNAMTVVAALGYGDIPPEAFFTAFNLIQNGGWIAFNIKEDFLRDEDMGGFSGLMNRLTRKNIVQMESYKRYCHRLNIAGDPLYYIAAVAQKIKNIPQEMMA